MKCALCSLDRPLRNSHIIPEFLHRAVYDRKHRVVLIGLDRSRPRVLQKGLSEPLLCDECEARIQKFEHYFAGLWYRTRVLPEVISEPALRLTGLDYRRLKLFLLSIVWRASCSTQPEFDSVDLAAHEPIIRSMLIEGDPGPADQYPIIAGVILDPESHRIWEQVLLAPIRIRIGPHWAYRMVFGGASWTVFVSSHLTLPLRDHLLSERGELKLATLDWPEFARVTGLAQMGRRVPPRIIN